MGFLKQPDYFTFIKEVNLQQVIENNQNYVVICEGIAQEEISMALRERYDVAAVFAAAGDARNPIVVSYMVCIVLYHVMKRVGQEMPQKYQDWYDSAKVTLTQIADGLMNPNLPRKQDADSLDVTPFILSSNDKMEDKW